jgi:hypothetical protein
MILKSPTLNGRDGNRKRSPVTNLMEIMISTPENARTAAASLAVPLREFKSHEMISIPSISPNTMPETSLYSQST